MSEAYDWFTTNTITRDFFAAMAGDQIGEGECRLVHVARLDPTKVIKFEIRGKRFQNAVEWNIWDTFGHNPIIARWLAKPTFIAACGTVLVMERTHPIPPNFKLPTKIPAFLADIKRDNFGILDGRLVCHDYGTGFRFEVNGKKLRKVTWK